MFQEIVFDLSTDDLASKHASNLIRFVKDLGKGVDFLYVSNRSVAYFMRSRRDFNRVVIFITNHSHDDTGDLYLGPDLCASVDDVSV